MASYDTGRYLADEIVNLGPFELICDSDPQTGIPAVAWKLVDGADPGYTLYDLADRLRIRRLAGAGLPVDRELADVAVQRILVRQGSAVTWRRSSSTTCATRSSTSPSTPSPCR